MQFSDVIWSDSLASFFSKLILHKSIDTINSTIRKQCGIIDFFDEISWTNFCEQVEAPNAAEPFRRAYGDFQTNDGLALAVTEILYKAGSNPTFILEPTCGKGSILRAALKTFSKTVTRAVGIEIYEPYWWHTKFSILHDYLQNRHANPPHIEIYLADIFKVKFANLAKETIDDSVLLLGNPPWITNAELGTLNSSNLPKKLNLKREKGLDAMTGKGNFDLGEYILLTVIAPFQRHAGHFAFLVKNAVVKNLLYSQRNRPLAVNSLTVLNIDAKKEFNASVASCLFYGKLNAASANQAHEFDFYSNQRITRFGWSGGKFVRDLDNYEQSLTLDGKSPFTWRQGLKHDCSKVMEFETANENFVNRLGETFELEFDLVYPLLKSSDLKDSVVDHCRKYTLVTQQKIGQSTNWISDQLPLTYNYLLRHKTRFNARKSSIYNGKPAFSIFGIGEYSFAPYKVAISGMYKRTLFSLILPIDGKPAMLDDTCYFIGFQDPQTAKITHHLLNGKPVQRLLQSIIFMDAKRPITKDILMRVNVEEAYRQAEKPVEITVEAWNKYGSELAQTTTTVNQMSLF